MTPFEARISIDEVVEQSLRSAVNTGAVAALKAVLEAFEESGALIFTLSDIETGFEAAIAALEAQA